MKEKMKSEDISLVDALSYSAKISLPEEYDEKKGAIWVLAIIHVTKCNGKSSYAIAKNNGYGIPEIIKDFGAIAKVQKVNHIYPYFYLNNTNLPDLRNHADIVNYLSYKGYDSDEVKLLLGTVKEDGTPKTKDEKEKDKQKLKKVIYYEAINSQLKEIETKKSITQDY